MSEGRALVDLEKVAGGVPNSGTTSTIIVKPGDALVKNNSAAISSASS